MPRPHPSLYTKYGIYRTAAQIASGEFKEGLNAVEWDDETREKLQTVVDESDQVAYCGDNDIYQ